MTKVVWTKKRKGGSTIYIANGVDRAIVDSPWNGIYWNGMRFNSIAEAQYAALEK